MVLGNSTILGVLLIGIFSVMFMPIAVDAMNAGDGSFCRGEPRSPWVHMFVGAGHPVDANGGNGNGWVCVNSKNGITHDDVCPRSGCT